jgi:hypothetical protein
VLADLTFEYRNRKYRCTPPDLIALGRAYAGFHLSDEAARCEGANQFKVTVEQVRNLFRGDSWIVRNCVVAVSASSNDGTAGVQRDASFAAWRKEVERLAHLVFASTQSVRDFWLGKSPSCSVEILEREHGGKKPCLHGSDAHCVERVTVPNHERYCWIKGDPTFESLRQAILEPEERVWVGRTPPRQARRWHVHGPSRHPLHPVARKRAVAAEPGPGRHHRGAGVREDGARRHPGDRG